MIAGGKSRLLVVMNRSAPMPTAVARWVASAAFSRYRLDRAAASSAVARSTGRRSSLASRPSRERRLRHRPELGYRLTGSGDSHRLPPGNPIHHITSVVAQFPNGYFRHEAWR